MRNAEPRDEASVPRCGRVETFSPNSLHPEPQMDTKSTETGALHQPRLEDDPLVRGLGHYADDVPISGQAYAYFVRSPHAFADIRAIETSAARATPGVLALLTAADTDGTG